MLFYACISVLISIKNKNIHSKYYEKCYETSNTHNITIYYMTSKDVLKRLSTQLALCVTHARSYVHPHDTRTLVLQITRFY